MQRNQLRAKLQCLAHTQHTGPTSKHFGLPAFVECLFKLALHKLGNKGSSELQRGAPAWWKCTWLLTLLSGQFNECHFAYLHENRVLDVAERDLSAKMCTKSSKEDDSTSPKSAVRARPATTVERERAGNRARFITPPASSRGSAPAIDTAMTDTIDCREGRDESDSSPMCRSTSENISDLLVNTGRTSTGEQSALNARRLQRRRHTVTTLEMRQVAGGEESAAEQEPQDAEGKLHFAASLDTWWLRVHTLPGLPRYRPPLERLVAHRPALFHPSSAEAPGPQSASSKTIGIGTSSDASPGCCPVCQEQRSPSGWGSPGCVQCSGVEELCLPMEDHLLSALLRSSKHPESPLESARSRGSDEDTSSSESSSDFGDE